MAARTDDKDDDSLTTVALLQSGRVNMADLLPTLPLETRCPPFPLRRFAGFWLPERILPGVAAVHAKFEPRPDDVFLASFPKSGTTWLKALAFATLHRAEHPPSGPDHPLHRGSPHECVRFFELAFALADGDADVFASFPSPRVLATHLPYSLLPKRVTASSRVVYVCRDPKDALVSGWLFTRKNMAAASKGGPAAADGEEGPASPPPEYTIEEAFELFCDGRAVAGPQWRHVLGYWEASLKRPDKVLFLRYEEMLHDSAGNVRRLADFLGCPFSGEEEAAGAVEDVVELCSLDSLKKGSTANQNDGRASTTELGIQNGAFFRTGAAGDWRNHLTPKMAARLDGILADELGGSGFRFGVATAED